MDITPFALERWLDRYESDAEYMLGESGIRPISVDRFDLDVGELGYVIPTDGDPEFRSFIGERYGRSADEVVLTCGAQEANFLTLRVLLDDDDHAIVVTPTYQALWSLPATFATVTEVRTNPPEWDLPGDIVADAIRPETRAIVMANPANPTGRYYDWPAMQQLAGLADEVDAYLVVDEVYRSLVPDPNPRVATVGEHVISTASVTKAYGLAGARLGWVVAERSIADGIRRWKDYTTISPPKLGHHIAMQALGGREDEILVENRRHARENRRLASAFVAETDLDWVEPTGVVGFPSVPDGFDSGRAFCESLFEEEGVLLVPGEVFDDPARFRLGFGGPTEELEEGLRRTRRHIDRAA